MNRLNFADKCNVATIIISLLAIVVGVGAMVVSAHGATWPNQAVLAKCSVYLPAVRDAKLRRYCLKLSKRMP